MFHSFFLFFDWVFFPPSKWETVGHNFWCPGQFAEHNATLQILKTTAPGSTPYSSLGSHYNKKIPFTAQKSLISWEQETHQSERMNPSPTIHGIVPKALKSKGAASLGGSDYPKEEFYCHQDTQYPEEKHTLNLLANVTFSVTFVPVPSGRNAALGGTEGRGQLGSTATTE